MEKEHYTYADYLEWDTNERYELINGEAVMMAGASEEHQGISMELSRQLANFLVGKPCNVYAAPFDVRLFEKDDEKPWNVDTIVQPDILVICDHKKIDKHGIKGAPDFVIEILSPSTSSYDCLVKLNLYMQAGVREYWIVDPGEKTVQVFLLDDESVYRVSGSYGQNDSVKVSVLNGCVINLSTVFSGI